MKENYFNAIKDKNFIDWKEYLQDQQNNKQDENPDTLKKTKQYQQGVNLAKKYIEANKKRTTN